MTIFPGWTKSGCLWTYGDIVRLLPELGNEENSECAIVHEISGTAFFPESGELYGRPDFTKKILGIYETWFTEHEYEDRDLLKNMYVENNKIYTPSCMLRDEKIIEFPVFAKRPHQRTYVFNEVVYDIEFPQKPLLDLKDKEFDYICVTENYTIATKAVKYVVETTIYNKHTGKITFHKSLNIDTGITKIKSFAPHCEVFEFSGRIYLTYHHGIVVELNPDGSSEYGNYIKCTNINLRIFGNRMMIIGNTFFIGSSMSGRIYKKRMKFGSAILYMNNEYILCRRGGKLLKLCRGA